MQLSIFLTVPPICGSENDDCDKNLASCENTQTGSYNCTCNQGYIGNGKKCIGKFTSFSAHLKRLKQSNLTREQAGYEIASETDIIYWCSIRSRCFILLNN